MLDPRFRAQDLRKTNPEVAALRHFIFMQGMITVLFDLFIFGPLLLPGFLGRSLAIGPTKYLRGAGSDLLSLSMTPLLILAMAFMGADDEEEIERALSSKIMRTYIGWGPTFLWDNFVWFAYLSLNNINGLAKQTERILGILPLPETGKSLIGQGIESLD